MSRRRKHTPQGDIPGKPQQKKASLKKQSGTASGADPGAARKSLSFSSIQSTLNWDDAEDKDLIRYFCLKCLQWPTHKDPAFWKECKNYVNARHGKKRSEGGCRKHMFDLKKKYVTLENAKEKLKAITVEDIITGNITIGTDPNSVSKF